MAARYSRFERRFWRDEKVRRLSEQAKLLMAYLLTCDANDGFPGLFLLRLSAVAEDLEWSVDTVKLRFGEIVQLGMARRDDVASVVWLPNAVKKWVDEVSSNNVKGWRRAWGELPDCPIVRAAFVRTIDELRRHEDPAKGAVLAAEFMKRPPAWFSDTPEQRSMFGEPPPKPLRSPSEGGSNPLPSPFGAPPNPLRTPFEQEQGQGQGQGQGVAPPPPPPKLTDLGQYLFSDLAEERVDLLHGASDEDLARAADKMARRIERDSGGLAHGGPYLADALAALPAWVEENRSKGVGARLAEVIRKFGYRVGDDAPHYERGKQAAASLRALDGAA